jgi:hypothetical protein
MTATTQMVLANKASKAAANHNAEEKSKAKSTAAPISIGLAAEIKTRTKNGKNYKLVIQTQCIGHR